MYLDDFNNNEDASYDELALELLKLETEGFEEVFAMITLHSNLGELEKYIEYAEMAMHQYDNTGNWRGEAGRCD